MYSAENPTPDIPFSDDGPDSSYFTKNPLPMWVFDLDTLDFLAVNDAALIKYGYSRKEFLKMNGADIRPAEDVERFHESARTIKNTPLLSVGEWRHRLKNGEIIDADVFASVVMYRGKRAGLVTVRDITERKKSEANLRQALGWQEAIFEGSRDAVLISGMDYSFVSVNLAACDLTGYTRDELLTMKSSDLRAPSSTSDFNKLHKDLNDAESTQIESVMRRKDGRIIHVELHKRRIEVSGKAYVHTTARDISDRKKTEIDLQKSEAKYHELIDSMPVGYYKSTSAGRFMDVNPAFCKMLGYTKEELLSMYIPGSLYFAPSEREGETKYTGFSPVTEVYRLKGKGGMEVWVEDFARYGRDDNGRIVFHEGICYDITESKHAGEALQSSETRFRAVIENSSDTVLLLDDSWRLAKCLNAPAYKRIAGYSVEERLGRQEFELVHPDDLRAVRDNFLSGMKQGRTARVEFRIKHRDGSWRWVEGVARDMLGDPSIHANVMHIRDIEERKSAERMLVESEERYRMLVDNSPDSIVVMTDGKFSYVNPKSVELFHARSAEDLVGRPAVEFVHPDSRADAAARLKRMMENRESLPLKEMKFLGVDGATLEVEVRSAPVMYLGKMSVQAVIRDITERKQVEKQLQLQGVALNTAANGIVITNMSGEIVWANPAFELLTGYSVEEALGKNPRDLIKSGAQNGDYYRSMWGAILSGKVWRGEIVNKRKDGTLYTEEMTIAPVRDTHGAITHFVAVKQDITDRKSLQQQLLQSQKLESIGQLAGGVAHDYNNILGVVIGYAELLKTRLADDRDSLAPVEAILTAATRAADLTRQLLAFARKDIISPKVLNLNAAVESIERMLRRIIGENISINFSPKEGLWNVKIDPSQLDQIFINLAANSRDAIQGVGQIDISLSNFGAGGEDTKTRPGMLPGKFVRMMFSDSGTGMKADVAMKVFEPFFTTKEKGHGTGLGLSTIYGIIKQNHGNIYVSSEPGKGTTFEIFLPRFDGAEDVSGDISKETARLGSETVLVVEDQEEMLDLTRASLENFGYHVLVAQGPEEAIRMCQTYKEPIQLLVTDVIMPVMSGKDLSMRIKELRPDIKILYMSGYTADKLDPDGMIEGDIQFIQKPFTPAGLANKAREVLKS